MARYMRVLCPRVARGNKVGFPARRGSAVKVEELPEDLRRVVAFHGHLCPGLLLGYRAARAAAGALLVGEAEDEELVAIVENRSCSVDAFQALLSTTFGKGNFFFRDHGKQVFTLADRRTGRAIRLAFRLGADSEHRGSREERMRFLLTADTADLFHMNLVEIRLPDPAEVYPTIRCSRCEEGVMSTRTVEDGSRTYCLPCARDLDLPLPPWFAAGCALVE
jgi:formylmethanofuran dehydrogenase subunit E